jgi:electron transfer flavoprotein alpha subunit
MIEVNPAGEVWIFAEQHHGKLEETPLELMSKGRQLADTLGVKMGLLLLGQRCEGLVDRLSHNGADAVYLAEHPLLEHYQTNPYARVICDLITRHKPQIVLFGATPCGRDLAPRIASAMKAGLTADCTDLQIGDHEVKKTGEIYKNLLFQVRPAFGGNIIATIINFDRWPQMATVREGVMPMPVPNTSHKAKVVRETVHLTQDDQPIQIASSSRTKRSTSRRRGSSWPAGRGWAAKKISGWFGIWPIAWAPRRRGRGRPSIWDLSIAIIRSARPAQPCGRACMWPSGSAGPSSTSPA